jgi:hypothetical protein
MSSSDIQSTFIEAAAAGTQTASANASDVGNNAAMTLTASPYVTDQARKITITAANNQSGISFTIVGLDETATAATETLTGPTGGATVTSTKYYSSVTSITAVGNPQDTGGNISAGTGADIAAPIYRGDLRMRGMYAVNTGTAGTINFTQGSASGTSRLKFNTVAAANTTQYPDIPEDGVVFRNGGYILFDQTKLSSITVFYA